MSKIAVAFAIALLCFTFTSRAGLILESFNTSEGHFTAPPFGGSGSSNGLASTSTHGIDTTTVAIEDGGSQRLSDLTTTSARLRHTSGGGTPANNVNFSTGSGVDGCIGVYVKTTAPGWNLQIYMEPGSTAPAATGSNGSIPKNLINDGDWHLYEWNLDDNSGGADGWGTISGIVTGVATVGDGTHTLDSLIFRNPASTASTNATFNIDFLAIGDSTHPHVNDYLASLPEPASLALLGLLAPMLGRRRR